MVDRKVIQQALETEERAYKLIAEDMTGLNGQFDQVQQRRRASGKMLKDVTHQEIQLYDQLISQIRERVRLLGRLMSVSRNGAPHSKEVQHRKLVAKDLLAEVGLLHIRNKFHDVRKKLVQ